jgi:hypothetical protein
MPGVILLIGIIAAAAACAFSDAPARAEDLAGAEGVSLTLKKDEDILKIRLTEPREPRISRYGTNNRIVIAFDNTDAMNTLKALLAGRRGGCVEKFEIQMMRRGAITGPYGGIRFLESPLDMLLIAYVESDVEADVRNYGSEYTIHFYRIGQEAAQVRPIPFNSVENINFEHDGIHLIVTVRTAEPITPSLYEEVDPHRILLSFSNTNLPDKTLNQIHRYMETVGFVRAEAFNLGMLPRQYDNIEDSREYHFVGFPSPLEFNEFGEAGFGLQSRDGIITFYPDKDVDYTVTLKGGAIYEMIFTKQVQMREKACGYYEFVPLAPAGEVYPLEDEDGRKLTPKE